MCILSSILSTYGSDEQPAHTELLEQPADKRDDPYELGLRTEHLLAVTNKQRSNHIERLASRNKCLEIKPWWNCL